MRIPAGGRLIDSLDLRLERGESMVITGPSGTGKTTLTAQPGRVVAGRERQLVTARRTTNETMFVSQLPYVPLGALRAVVSYPASTGRH